MDVDKDIKSLASYVTYRQLFDDGKRDVYFVISQFAENIIVTQKLFSFGLTELSEQIRNQFGFDIPDYVVQASLRRLNYIEKINHAYIVNPTLLPLDGNIVSDSIECATDKNTKLVNDLLRYVANKKDVLNVNQRQCLMREFCSFLLDNSAANGFSNLISAFILENENNQEFKAHLTQIKEGAVLFAGLNYNSNISDNSAWKDEITIYVENEILFHLAGYNGKVFQKLTEELFGLINEMNLKSKKRVIKVRYFREVSDEINTFFDKAREIVEGKEHVTVDNYAMAEIVRGCHTAADVIDKKSKFYMLLRNKTILQEEEREYYADQYHEYNLESPEAIKKYNIEEDKLRYIKHLNYVNILRKGKAIRDLKKSKYIVLTETGKMLRMATEFTEEPVYTPLAVNMNVLTNRLWYDLNKGFGANEFPATFDVVIKSRIILSKILTQNVADKFEEAKKKYYRKEINAEQLADSILLLREEIKKPEDIKSEVLEDVLSFISEDKLEIYKSEKELLENKLSKSEEERALLIASIKQKDVETEKIYKQATEENELLYRKNIELIEKRKLEIKSQIADIEKRKDNADRKINTVISVTKIIIVTLILMYYIGVFLIFVKANANMQVIIPMLLSLVPPAVSVATSLICEKKFDFFELYKKIMNSIKSRYSMKIYSEYSIDLEKLNELTKDLNNLEKQE